MIATQTIHLNAKAFLHFIVLSYSAEGNASFESVTFPIGTNLLNTD